MKRMICIITTMMHMSASLLTKNRLPTQIMPDMVMHTGWIIPAMN